ncbi:hypothetical protein M5D96_011768 [Drosophila gunungcola]|uniref:Uncharacterized protein n=1 Tax=Drosophila gunungcola TaxID=103775 RepID=A0A9P9YEG0_9MUSC|nr:hypothetical protein M5D96_011768 [Drosophila gunungcola]
MFVLPPALEQIIFQDLGFCHVTAATTKEAPQCLRWRQKEKEKDREGC